MKDIENREDVERLVDLFYAKILESDIAYLFTEVAQLDLEAHMPIMYDFWCTMLLSERSYDRNPMIKHIELNKKSPLTQEAFKTWIFLFHETIDEMYAGSKAEEAKMRSQNIAKLMQFKVSQES